jgi:hypothetical protein
MEEIDNMNTTDEEHVFREWMIEKIVEKGLDEKDIFNEYLYSDELFDMLTDKIGEQPLNDLIECMYDEKVGMPDSAGDYPERDVMVDQLTDCYKGDAWELYQWFYGTHLIPNEFYGFLEGCRAKRLIEVYEEVVV